MIGRGLLLFRLSGWGEVCCCSGCQDGEKSVVVRVVRIERGLLLLRLLGLREVCCCSVCRDREMERGLLLFRLLG